MSSHAERVRALYRDVWNGEDPSTVEDLVHEDYVIHDRELAAERSGPALYAQLAEETREIFPDMAFEIEDLFTSGDRVAVRWTMTGTHRGPLFGVEGTGERVELSAIEINRFEGELLVETWTQSDQLGMLGQIGALPE